MALELHTLLEAGELKRNNNKVRVNFQKEPEPNIWNMTLSIGGGRGVISPGRTDGQSDSGKEEGTGRSKRTVECLTTAWSAYQFI